MALTSQLLGIEVTIHQPDTYVCTTHALYLERKLSRYKYSTNERSIWNYKYYVDLSTQRAIGFVTRQLCT